MSVRDRAAQTAIEDAARERARAHLNGEYPKWKLTVRERYWVKQLRKADARKAGGK